MRWFLALVVGVAVLAGGGPARAAESDRLTAPEALVLVERLTIRPAPASSAPARASASVPTPPATSMRSGYRPAQVRARAPASRAPGGGA